MGAWRRKYPTRCHSSQTVWSAWRTRAVQGTFRWPILQYTLLHGYAKRSTDPHTQTVQNTFSYGVPGNANALVFWNAHKLYAPVSQKSFSWKAFRCWENILEAKERKRNHFKTSSGLKSLSVHLVWTSGQHLTKLIWIVVIIKIYPMSGSQSLMRTCWLYRGWENNCSVSIKRAG